MQEPTPLPTVHPPTVLIHLSETSRRDLHLCFLLPLGVWYVYVLLRYLETLLDQFSVREAGEDLL